MPEEMKRYIAFKPGSYWIYQDSATGKTDSVYVDYYFFKRDTGWEVTNQYQIDYDACELRTVSSYDGYFYDYEISTRQSGISNHRHKMFREKLKFGDYVGWTACFEYPFVDGNKLYVYNDIIITIKHMDSFTHNNMIYRNVSIVSNTENYTEFQSRTITYFGENVGVIRKVNIDSNNVWNLIKYQIFK